MSLKLPAIFEFPGVIINTQEHSKLEAGVLKMVRRIRPDWRKEEIILQKFDVRNSILFGGYTTVRNEMVVVKVYQQHEVNQKRLTDEALTIRLLALEFLGPRLFATFCNGFALDFFSGKPLDFSLATQQSVYPIVARKVGEMHRKLSAHMGVDKMSNSRLFENLRSWILKLPMRLKDSRLQLRRQEELPTKSSILNELEELETKLVMSPVSPYGDGFRRIPPSLQSAECPRVVFCHGNLTPANIFYDPTQQTISFVHPEYSGPNYQSFELAQIFLSLCGPDLDKVGRQEFVPAPEFQRRWCQHYLAAFRNVEIHKIPLQEIEKLFQEIQRFSLLFCLQEVVWSLVNVDAGNDSSGFDILQYGIQRYSQYQKNKYNILSLAI